MKKTPENDFNAFCRRIERAYNQLGHSYGWRFLYTPKATLSSKNKILFLGLNPGLKKKTDPTIRSVEEGNAYRDKIEPWADGELSPLQRQVCQFYELLAKVWPGTNRNRLMDSSLSSNFIPFRSKSIAKLRNRNDSLLFAKELWRDILDLTAPKMIITMGNDVRRQFDKLLTEHHGGISNTKEFSCAWGKYKYRLAFTEISGQEVLVISLPHLSRFKIFGRKNNNDKRTFAPLVEAVKRHLKK